MKTYSELQDLAKQLTRRVQNNAPDVGAIVICWNRGTERTPVAIFTHVGRGKAEHKVVLHILRSSADQMEANQTAEAQGMFITPAGLLVPKA